MTTNDRTYEPSKVSIMINGERYEPFSRFVLPAGAKAAREGRPTKGRRWIAAMEKLDRAGEALADSAVAIVAASFSRPRRSRQNRSTRKRAEQRLRSRTMIAKSLPPACATGPGSITLRRWP